jgi:hypothetical protein
MGKKKTNPRRIAATMADVEKAEKNAQSRAISYAFSIFFTVLLDKENADMEQLQRIWREVNDLSDSIARGYVNVSDLLYTLKTEYGIELE